MCLYILGSYFIFYSDGTAQINNYPNAYSGSYEIKDEKLKVYIDTEFYTGLIWTFEYSFSNDGNTLSLWQPGIFVSIYEKQ